MKKIILGLGLVCGSFFITSCDDINTTEKVLMDQCEKESREVNCHAAYTRSLDAVTKARTVNNDDSPFGGQQLIFKLEDMQFQRENPQLRSINQLWHDSTGKWIYPPNGVEASQSGDTKKVGQSYVLSPAMYDELISAVKTCNRATVEAMDFKAGSTLTPEQYDKAMNIIIQCKQSQLDAAINNK